MTLLTMILKEFPNVSEKGIFSPEYETHFNPPGTIDCGDGYLDDDGVFTEY